jgi:hypothetical protein
MRQNGSMSLSVNRNVRGLRPRLPDLRASTSVFPRISRRVFPRATLFEFARAGRTIWLASVMMWPWSWVLADPLFSADRLLLRNLEIVSDRTVVRFDEDGLKLDDGRLLTWDEVERGTVAAGQKEFDQLLDELGEPLYRIRQRMAVGDYQSILGHAEAVFPRFAARRSPTAFMVCHGLMWARLAAGRREAALEPYLLAAEQLRNRSQQNASGGAAELLPGDRRLRWDEQTGLSDEFVPIWFDASAASEALPGVGRAVGGMKKPWLPAVPLYYASLALGAGDESRATAALRQFDSPDPALKQLAAILSAQREIVSKQPDAAVAQLRKEWETYQGMNRALACYWLGRLGVQESDEQRRRDGILMLLRVPALEGATYPDLAAAALDEAGRTLAADGDEGASRILRRELLGRYGTTYHARQLPTRPWK